MNQPLASPLTGLYYQHLLWYMKYLNRSVGYFTLQDFYYYYIGRNMLQQRPSIFIYSSSSSNNNNNNNNVLQDNLYFCLRQISTHP
jgi:hypothetical protein